MKVFYIICPVGSDPSFPIKRAIITEIAGSEGCTVYFPMDETSTDVFDLDTILEKFRHVDYIIADLSLERPSCYYETGLAQALKKKVLLIAQADTDIHQIDRRDSVLFYNDRKDYRRVLHRLFKESDTEQEALPNLCGRVGGAKSSGPGPDDPGRDA